MNCENFLVPITKMIFVILYSTAERTLINFATSEIESYIQSLELCSKI